MQPHSPLHACGHAAPVPTADRDMSPSAAQAGPQVLICEGSRDLLAVLTRDLSRAGYRVQQARSAEDMMTQLAQVRPDLILCNTDLPGTDGMAVLHVIRQFHPGLDDVPVLMVSAHSDPSDIAAGKRAGADDYLTLPVDADNLVASVVALLRQAARIKRAHAVTNQAMTDLTGIARAQAYEHLLNHFSFGIILADNAGQTVFMNDAACRMTGRDPRTIRPWLLRRAALASICARVATAGTDPKGAHLSALVGGGETDQIAAPLLATALRLSADGVTAILLYVPRGSEDLGVQLVANAVGLTPTETSVAQLLSRGMRIEEIMAQLSISRPTVNFHLQNTFRKTATCRQADLIALLHSVQLHQ